MNNLAEIEKSLARYAQEHLAEYQMFRETKGEASNDDVFPYYSLFSEELTKPEREIHN